MIDDFGYRPGLVPRVSGPVLSCPSVPQFGATAIILAAREGQDQVLEQLLAAKAEVNAADQVRDEARADQARPQPALRLAVTEHTGQSRSRTWANGA
jgi:hypothetical protein